MTTEEIKEAENKSVLVYLDAKKILNPMDPYIAAKLPDRQRLVESAARHLKYRVGKDDELLETLFEMCSPRYVEPEEQTQSV